MQLNPQEIAALAQAEAHAAPRMDIYAFIHKALCAWMADTLVALGRMDAGDGEAVAETGERVLQLLEFCRSHLRHEDAFVHPLLERHEPGSSAGIGHDHVLHRQAIDALVQGVAHLQVCPAPQRARAAQALYRQLALFVAHNLEHMHQEETGHNAVLWRHCSDAQLAQVEDAIVASQPPEEALLTMRWMLPHLTHGERVQVLSGMREAAPPGVFDLALDTARPHLSVREWSRLAHALGLAP